VTEIAPQLLQHILSNLPALLIRDYLLDLLTGTEKTCARYCADVDGTAVPEDGAWIYTGKLLDIAGSLYGVIGEPLRRSKGVPVYVKSLDLATTDQLCLRNSKISLQPGDIANYQGEGDLQTTIGRLLLNYVILVDSFGDLIPYINQEWKIGQIEETYIFENLRSGKITVEQLKH
jgi:hypothetical protein